MDVSFSQAANAYMNRMRAEVDAAAQDNAAAAGTNKPSFTDLLSNAVESLTESQHNAEALKMESISGKVDMTDLVTAVTSAELTLNTVVAVRDRVIAAYQDIMRMPI